MAAAVRERGGGEYLRGGGAAGWLGGGARGAGSEPDSGRRAAAGQLPLGRRRAREGEGGGALGRAWLAGRFFF